jgi:hypothetical protein
MVVTAPPRPPVTRRPTAHQKPEKSPPVDDHTAAWAFIWVLFAFKMATVFLIWWASRSYETGIFLLATTWFWAAIPLIALAAPLAFRWRLMKVRKRRSQLQRSEWVLESSRPSADKLSRMGASGAVPRR